MTVYVVECKCKIRKDKDIPVPTLDALLLCTNVSQVCAMRNFSLQHISHKALQVLYI